MSDCKICFVQSCVGSIPAAEGTNAAIESDRG